MNVFDFYKRGTQHADILHMRKHDAQEAELKFTTEQTRNVWINALQVDEIRAWMSVGECDEGVLVGLSSMLAMAGMVMASELKTDQLDTPEAIVMRTAVENARACVAAGNVVTVDAARAMSAGADAARLVFKNASRESIQHAAVSMRLAVGLD